MPHSSRSQDMHDGQACQLNQQAETLCRLQAHCQRPGDSQEPCLFCNCWSLTPTASPKPCHPVGAALTLNSTCFKSCCWTTTS